MLQSRLLCLRFLSLHTYSFTSIRQEPPSFRVGRNAESSICIWIVIIYAMMQTLKVKLDTSAENNRALLETMHQFNAACNYVGEKAFELHTANKIELQKIVYRDIREMFGISAQMAVRAISKS